MELRGETTGRHLILFEDGATKAGVKALREATGAEVVSAAAERPRLEGEGTVVFGNLGVAVVSAPPEEIDRASAPVRGRKPIRAVEPERVVYALEGGRSAEYLRGYATPC